MRYWVYADNEVKGPFEKENLKSLPGFGKASMVCPETPAAGQTADWKPASSFPEVMTAITFQPPAETPNAKPEESPLMMTMRGTIIDLEEQAPAPKPAASAQTKPEPAAQPKVMPEESPLMMTMRGTLMEPSGEAPQKEQRAAPPMRSFKLEPPPSSRPAPAPAAAQPHPTPPPRLSGSDGVTAKLDRLAETISAVSSSQAQMLERLDRLEKSLSEMRSFFFHGAQKKD